LMHPNAEETCDEIDNDCNGIVDDVDADEDGFEPLACGGDDCDDNDAATNPEAAEVCDDYIDNDCDGLTDGEDEDCSVAGDDDTGETPDCECRTAQGTRYPIGRLAILAALVGAMILRRRITS